jgi:hypothetical protein
VDDVKIVPDAAMIVGVAMGATDANVRHTATESRSVVFSSVSSGSDDGSSFSPSVYAHNLTVISGSVYFYWTLIDNHSDPPTIDVSILVKASGWIALGVTKGSSAGMRECDVVTGYGENGTVPTIKDQFVDGYMQPSDDVSLAGGSSDITNTKLVRRADGFSALIFTRKLAATDKWDRAINIKSTQFVVAWSASSNDPRTAHTPQERALFTVNLEIGTGVTIATGDLRGIHGILMFLAWGFFAVIGILPSWAIRGKVEVTQSVFVLLFDLIKSVD